MSLGPVAPGEPGAPAAPSTRLGRWVAFWNEYEPPHVLALIRILLALVVLTDLAVIARHDIAAWIWAPASAGGFAPFDSANPPLFYRLFEPSPSSAQLLWLGLVASLVCFGIGLCTRGSAVVFVFLYAQAALINPLADRAIDRVIRIAMLILACSACGRAWSFDARIASGRFRGSGEPQPAWPRYLILAQLVLLYTAAGFAKSGTTWYPWGGYNALYLILQTPIMATRDFAWLALPLPYFFTRVATALTHLWELAAPVVLVAAFCRRSAGSPGRWRALVNRLPIRNVYIAFGVAFHLMLALTLELGIFPFGMLALFPAFFRPAELESARAALRRSRAARTMR